MSRLHARGRMPRRLLAIASSTVLLTGVGVAAAPAAFAADPDTSASHASAQFLSVTGGPSTGGATADYRGDGGPSGEAVKDSNDVASLRESLLGQSVNVGLGSEYAEAGAEGKSWAASGGVTAEGAPTEPGSVDIDLGALLDSVGIKNNIVEKMQLSLQGISSVAAVDAQKLADGIAPAATCDDWAAPDHCRDYTLGSGSLTIQSDALAGVMAQIQSLAADIDQAIGTVTTTLPSVLTDTFFAPMNAALSAALVGHPFDARIPLLGGHVYEITSASLAEPDITVDVSGTVAATLAGIIAAPHSINGVTVDLGSGNISVNYDIVMGSLNAGGGLNNLPANTPLFGTKVIESITESINAIIDGFAGELSDAISALLDAINVTVTATATPTMIVADTPYRWVFGHFNNWTWVPGHYEQDGEPLSGQVSGLGVSGSYSGTLYDILKGSGNVELTIDNWPNWLTALGFDAPSVGGFSLPGIPGGISDSIIQSVVNSGASALKAATKVAIDGIAGLLNSASSVFGGTINVQDETDDGEYRETALELWFNTTPAAPLRGSGGAFRAVHAPAAYTAPPAGATVIRIGTAIVGPNRHALTCAPDTHYDPATGTCIADPTTPGGGVPGGGGQQGGTPGGGTPTDTSTAPDATEAPAIDVAGESDETASDIVQPSDITVKGESDEIAEEVVPALAATGPHETGLFLLLGLELLLAGLAITRIAGRRGRVRQGRS